MPAITINNTGSPFRIQSDGNTFSKAPDIILNSGKKINNSAGSVTLKNSNGSVILNGEIFSLTSTKISTPNGGTIINNTGGLQNVGEDPMFKYTFGSQKFSDWLQEALATQYMVGSSDSLTFRSYDEYLHGVYIMAMNYKAYNATARRQLLSDLAGTSDWYTGNDIIDSTKWKSLMLAKYGTAPTEPKGSIVSGGAVSIVAKTLNINGLIQSGFNNYVGEVNFAALYNLQMRGNRSFDDDTVAGNKQFRINNKDAETVYNSQTGMYDKVIGLYFNPKTANILTDPVQASGGTIYLNAQDIISTGNGKIIAAGGGADINIDSKDASGTLIVKDINTTSRPDPLIMINGVDYTNRSSYQPKSNAVYAWTGGISYNKIETKSSSTLKLLKWKFGSTEDLVDKINNEKLAVRTISTSNPSAGGDILQNGVFTDYSGNSNYQFSITSNRKSGGKVYGKTSVHSEDLDLFGVLTEYTYTWTETTPNYVGTTYRINAAQPISIQTTNKTDSTINITNVGDIIIKSDLGSGADGTVDENLYNQFVNNTADKSKLTEEQIS